MENIHQALLTNIVEVIFTKADGSERIMKCTLLPDAIEALNDGESSRYDESKYNPEADLERVVDVELGDWRAFKPSRVKSWRVL